MTSTRELTSSNTTYMRLFRLIFVLFSLYLLGDAFFRWDGFRYYAPFSEFLTAVALISVLWSTLAAFTTLLVWLLLRITEWICRLVKLKLKTEQLLLLFTTVGLFGSAVWAVKRLITRSEATPLFKISVFFSVVVAAILITWLLQNKIERWIEIIQERITPLVWLFMICVMLSVPLVAYHTWFKLDDDKVSQKSVYPSGENKDRPNILLLTFDALTTTDMSTYGYKRETSPFITEWSKAATLFKRLEAESNFTAPTSASLMTGKRVWTHRRQHNHGNPPVRSETENIPLLLRENGYHTMALTNNPVASAQELGMTNAFAYAPPPTDFTSVNSLLTAIRIMLDRLFLGKITLHDWFIKEDFIFYKIVLAIQPTFDQLRRRHSTAYAPELVYKKFLTLLDDNIPEPFFVWIHVYPPHDPYMPDAPYMGMYDPSPELRTGTSQYKILHDWKRLDKNPHTFEFPDHIGPEVIDVFRARYNEFILYCDNRFKEFVSELSKRNIFQDSVVIMSADHGDIFRPPFLTHGNSLFEPETHIPLIIKEPGQEKGKIINDLIEQIDVSATILDFADIPIPSWMEGRSVVPLLHGEELRPKTAFSMGLQFTPSRPGKKITKANIAVWDGDYKLIYNLERKESVLFNLTQDPDELDNLRDKEPEMVRRLLNLINENLERANEKIISDSHL